MSPSYPELREDDGEYAFGRPENTRDAVNHPPHYNEHPSGIECITIVRHMGFNIGNVIKYLWRSGLKDSEPLLKDLYKARWYLEDEIKRLERK